MINLSDLLKEGTKHLTGVSEATLQNITAVQDLSKITRTSLGPNGMNKMVVNHLEKLFVTSDAAAIVRELDVIHPAARLTVLAQQMQEQEVGDGTNLVLVLTGEFLSNAEQLLTKGLHPSEIITGYDKAGKRALELLGELVVHTLEDPRDQDQVAKCLKTAISSKQLGYEDLLSGLVAKACIQVLPKHSKNFNVDNVRIAKILGGGVLDTQVVLGHVVPRDSEGTIKHVTSAKIAVFAGGIDISKTETKDQVKIYTASDLINFNTSEEQAMEKVIKAISETGTKVIVCGSSISEMALHFIERYKMMVVKVPSKFDLRRVCKAIGASPLIRLGAPTPEELGFADIVSVDEIGSTKVCIFRTEGEQSGISTILVRASTQNMLDDFERAIQDGVNVYKAMMKDPRFVTGASATEIELSTRIQAFGDSTPGLSQYAIKKYGEAFEAIPRTLAENAGLKSTDVLSSLYASHSRGNINDGIDIEKGEVGDALALGVLDLLITKYSAIRLATDAAITVLRVDQIIMSKQAGGPKPPKQTAPDADD